MAEIVGTTAAVGSLLKAITSTVSLLQGISRAPHEAQQVASQIHATKAVLKSLQANLKIVHQPQEFLDIWNGPTRLVLKNVKTTIEALNARLGGKGSTPPRLVTLSFWSKLKWPLEREEGVVLQLQLQGYLQLLALVQSSLMKGTASDVRASALEIEDILSKTSTVSLTSAALSQLSPDIASTSTASQTESEVYSEPYDSLSHSNLSDAYPSFSSPSTKPSSIWSQDCETITAVSDLEDPSQPVQFPSRLGLLLHGSNRFSLKCEDFAFGPPGSRFESLGRGLLTLYETALQGYRPVLWIVFSPDLAVDQESRWWSDPRCVKSVRKRDTGTNRYSVVSVQGVFPNSSDKLPKAEALEFRGSPAVITGFLEELPKVVTSLTRKIELRKLELQRRTVELHRERVELRKKEVERAKRESQRDAARRCAARMAPRPSTIPATMLSRIDEVLYAIVAPNKVIKTEASRPRTTPGPTAIPSTRDPGSTNFPSRRAYIPSTTLSTRTPSLDTGPFRTAQNPTPRRSHLFPVEFPETRAPSPDLMPERLSLTPPRFLSTPKEPQLQAQSPPPLRMSPTLAKFAAAQAWENTAPPTTNPTTMTFPSRQGPGRFDRYLNYHEPKIETPPVPIKEPRAQVQATPAMSCDENPMFSRQQSHSTSN